MLSELMYLVSIRSAVAMLIRAAVGALGLFAGVGRRCVVGTFNGPRSGRGMMRYAAVLMLAGIVAAPAVFFTSVQAQSAITLVSNTGQTYSSSTAFSVGTLGTPKYTHAQSFTTGDDAAGYTLSSVELDIVGSTYNTNDTARLSIYTANSNGKPAAVKYTLTNPSSVSDGLNAFTAPTGSTLEKETEYVVVVEQTGSGSFNVRVTPSNGQSSDDTGAGWAIRDNRWWRGSDAGAWGSAGDKLRISVNGFLGAVSASSDATLSDLTIGAGSDTTLLVPGFAAATTSYTASVANSVDEITVTPTTTDDTAAVEYLDGSDAGIDDADGTADGQQAPLDVGENTIKIKVTAEDGTTTQTYSIIVTRQAQSAITLVSNTGLSPSSTDSSTVGTVGTFKFTQAQSFTTGNNTDGYTLSSVELDIVGSTYNTNNTARVSIYTADSNGNPARGQIHVDQSLIRVGRTERLHRGRRFEAREGNGVRDRGG